MKRFPQCNRTFADETITFCLADGALLSAPYSPEATQVMSPPPTVPPTTVTLPPEQAASPVRGRSRSINLSFVIILLMAVLLAGSAVALFYERGKENSNSSARQLESPTPTMNTSRPEQTTINAASPTATNQARFSTTSCGSIRDMRTGLEWFVGPDQNMTWYEAQQWTGGLGVCGGSWRMPTIEEIRTLYDPALKAGTGFYTSGRYFPAHIDPAFNAIGGGSWVWANESVGDTAQSFNLNQGKPVRYSAMNTFYSTRAFAVRHIRN